MFSEEMQVLFLHMIPLECFNTLYMVFFSLFLSILLGLPLGLLLHLTKQKRLCIPQFIYSSLSWGVGVLRSFPFAILMVALIPLARVLIGTSLGTHASIISLSIAATPFIARLFEQSFDLVDIGTINACLLMGASTRQLISSVLIPESLPHLIQGATTTAITLISYSAMVGAVGGGGLGKIAIQYGYLRFDTEVMVFTIVLLILLVQGIQYVGNFLSSRILRERGLLP